MLRHSPTRGPSRRVRFGPTTLGAYRDARKKKSPTGMTRRARVVALCKVRRGGTYTTRYYARLSMFAIVNVSCAACVVMLVNSPISVLAPASEDVK